MPLQSKIFSMVLLILFVSLTSYPQKKFSLSIKLDSNIHSRNVSCQYYNGKRNVEITDTFINNTLRIKGIYFSEKATFSIAYQQTPESSFTEYFFISEKPAGITMYFDPGNVNRSWGARQLSNALPLLDEIYNPLYKKLTDHRIKESTALSEFWKSNGDKAGVNDSITQQSIQLFKALNNRTLIFLKNNAQNYYSFWHFKNQIVNPAIAMNSKDMEYFKELITAFKAVFPEKFTKSEEGEILLKEMELFANPPIKVGDIIPAFEVKSMEGNVIHSGASQSKFILLNFWQTWCIPCVREIPSLIGLRERYTPEKLEIISVNNETNAGKVSTFIKDHKMNWPNIRDEGDRLKYLFRVNAYPTIVLLDNKGVIKYVMVGLSDTSEIMKIVGE